LDALNQELLPQNLPSADDQTLDARASEVPVYIICYHLPGIHSMLFIYQEFIKDGMQDNALLVGLMSMTSHQFCQWLEWFVISDLCYF